MLSWLMIVARETDRTDLDAAVTLDQTVHIADWGVLTWTRDQLTLRTGNGDVLPLEPETNIPTSHGLVSLVEGQIEEPPPPQRPKLRLPGSGVPDALLLVQDGSFRGCFFALSREACHLGQGASVHMNEQKTAILTNGSGTLEVSGASMEAHTKQPLKDGDVIGVGERHYQLRHLPAAPTANS